MLAVMQHQLTFERHQHCLPEMYNSIVFIHPFVRNYTQALCILRVLHVTTASVLHCSDDKIKLPE